MKSVTFADLYNCISPICGRMSGTPSLSRILWNLLISPPSSITGNSRADFLSQSLNTLLFFLLPGEIQSSIWSPDFEVNVAIGMVDKKFWGSNSNLFIDYSENDRREIYIQEKFWS